MIHRLSGVCAGLRRRGAFLVLAALPALLLAACATPEPPPLPDRVDIPHSQGRLWKVEGEGIYTSYLFGTMHVSDPRVLDVPHVVRSSLRSADIAAFEIAPPPDQERPRFGEDRYKLPRGTTLTGLIGNRAWGQLVSIYKGRGYWKPRNDIKPWVFWDIMGGAWGTFYGNDRQRNPDQPILDDMLEEIARNTGKEVVSLETEEEHFAVFDSMPMEIQISLLQTTLDHYHERTYGVPRIQIYLDGDLGLARALWEESLGWLEPEAARVLDDRLIHDRNRVLVDRAVPLMQRGSTFVGVGAAHMAGERGMLRLLEQRGYTVTLLR
ncbi:MAG: TraB/GumN family protein [Kiloniellaceae bacterium]